MPSEEYNSYMSYRIAEQDLAQSGLYLSYPKVLGFFGGVSWICQIVGISFLLKWV